MTPASSAVLHQRSIALPLSPRAPAAPASARPAAVGEVHDRARHIHRTLGARRAAGYLRNRGFSLLQAKQVLGFRLRPGDEAL